MKSCKAILALLALLITLILAASSASAGICSNSLPKRLDLIGNQYGFECALPNGETVCVAKRAPERQAVLEAYLTNEQRKVAVNYGPPIYGYDSSGAPDWNAINTTVNNDEISHNYLEQDACLEYSAEIDGFYSRGRCERSDTINATYSMNASTLKGSLTRKHDRDNPWYQSNIHDVTTTAFTCSTFSTETLAQNAADTIAAMTTKAVVKDGTPYTIGDVDVRAMTVSLDEMAPSAGKIREDLLKLGVTQAFNTAAIYNNTIHKPAAPLKAPDFLTGTKKKVWRCFAVIGGSNKVPLSLSGSESATISFKPGSGRANDLGLTEILKAEVIASTLKTPVFPDGQNVTPVNSSAEKSVFMSTASNGVAFSTITHFTREEMGKLSGIDREGLVFKGRICVRE